ncbi:hypothetical protein N9118_11535 [Akkermansiaceae bacterium]|nr:hypothetical protein [Akkermansiaceae bacterium]
MPDYAPIWQIKASFVSKYRGEGCPRSRSTNYSIKGRSDKLKPLLNTLSYRHNGTSFANSDAHRTAIFLGDLINPKNDYLLNGTSEVLHSERTSITLFPLPVAMRVLPFLTADCSKNTSLGRVFPDHLAIFATFRDYRTSIREAGKGMHIDTLSFVPVYFCALVFPDRFLPSVTSWVLLQVS